MLLLYFKNLSFEFLQFIILLQNLFNFKNAPKFHGKKFHKFHKNYAERNFKERQKFRSN